MSEREQERAAVVAWLQRVRDRAHKDRFEFVAECEYEMAAAARTVEDTLKELVLAIEAGEHLKERT